MAGPGSARRLLGLRPSAPRHTTTPHHTTPLPRHARPALSGARPTRSKRGEGERRAVAVVVVVTVVVVVVAAAAAAAHHRHRRFQGPSSGERMEGGVRRPFVVKRYRSARAGF